MSFAWVDLQQCEERRRARSRSNEKRGAFRGWEGEDVTTCGVSNVCEVVCGLCIVRT